MAVSAVEATRCRCGTLVVMVIVERTGKRSGFHSDPDGEWVINDEGKASHQGKAPEFFPHFAPRYTSHFQVCAHDPTRKR